MDYKALATWALGDGVGASSVCIARHMMGLENEGDHPYDRVDFKRCEDLLNQVPSLRNRMPEMISISKEWAAIVPVWDEIRDSPDTSALIRKLTFI